MITPKKRASGGLCINPSWKYLFAGGSIVIITSILVSTGKTVRNIAQAGLMREPHFVHSKHYILPAAIQEAPAKKVLTHSKVRPKMNVLQQSLPMGFLLEQQPIHPRPSKFLHPLYSRTAAQLSTKFSTKVIQSTEMGKGKMWEPGMLGIPLAFSRITQEPVAVSG